MHGVDIAALDRRKVLKSTNIVSAIPSVLKTAHIVFTACCAIPAQQTVDGELGIEVGLLSRRQQLIPDCGLDALQPRAQAVLQKPDVDLLGRARPTRGLIRMSNHRRMYAEPAADFLDVECARFEQLRILRIDADRAEIHSAFE